LALSNNQNKVRRMDSKNSAMVLRDVLEKIFDAAKKKYR
jgi:hypothetical protein